jgi:DNA mismatch repair protein MSH3
VVRLGRRWKGRYDVVRISSQTIFTRLVQVLKLKKDNPGVLLMVEVGYKLKFFDDDAKVSFHVSPGLSL